VFICTADQYHAEQAIACADAGKHVMLEKPMVQTEKEADALEAARTRNRVVIFIGFMRRYALAYKRFKEEIAGQEIKYVRVRDIIGDVSLVSSPLVSR
jgi:predicted dehydrogenase